MPQGYAQIQTQHPIHSTLALVVEAYRKLTLPGSTTSGKRDEFPTDDRLARNHLAKIKEATVTERLTPSSKARGQEFTDISHSCGDSTASL